VNPNDLEIRVVRFDKKYFGQSVSLHRCSC
jgi:hypothetical protein